MARPNVSPSGEEIFFDASEIIVSKTADGDCVAPSVATASDRSYPIARPLFMYTNGEPTGEIKKYMDWIKSDTGQCILVNKGYAPARSVSCN